MIATPKPAALIACCLATCKMYDDSYFLNNVFLSLAEVNQLGLCPLLSLDKRQTSLVTFYLWIFRVLTAFTNIL
jgi:hypothetical protein